METDFVVVLCTTPDRETALRLARGLVEQRLAACGNVVPGVTSIYRWEGAVHEADEVLLVLKTRADEVPALAAAIAAAHPYEVPEVVALPILDGHAPYLEWLRSAT